MKKPSVKKVMLTVSAAAVIGAPFAAAGLPKAEAASSKSSAAPKVVQVSKVSNPKNVILFIGDGYGQAARNATRLTTVGKNGKLEMESMPYTGFVSTDAGNTLVTDSAAAATAIATGVKTYNGAIGMDLNKKPVTTIMERAKKAGLSTGVVTTSQVTDATGAAFGAHVENRSEQSKIAKQFIENSKIDVILGGGEDFWYPKGTPGPHKDAPAEDPSEGSKGTEGNLVDKAKKLGYQHVSNKAELKAAKGGKLLGLFANEEMFQAHNELGNKYNPTVPLPEMTSKAIEVLSKNKKGFFLMVEEEGTDEMAHDNDGALTIQAGIQFDKAVKVAKDYAKSHPDTLVLVTADHETGGMAIEGDDKEDESGDGISKEDGPFDIKGSKDKFYIDWTTDGHTSVDVALSAMGPGAEQFEGYYPNTAIHDKLLKLLKLKK
ncbi:alkaline phosphatase [Paenibacillus sp. JX-17]|uniref:Alkaline phosphatase n=1 Tax=Paenibacillus lacisoli TaxID=3064525 RepID=A0ABT9CEF4_9BACL|nr:alkaline phosphatase [Paenibacillus sp. JX-17]MDO7906342.1 alkaline phosphatase [Paenibacillus sp. JX-17]